MERKKEEGREEERKEGEEEGEGERRGNRKGRLTGTEQHQQNQSPAGSRLVQGKPKRCSGALIVS